MVLSSTMDYLEWINQQNPALEMSWLVNYIETTRKIFPRTPEIAIARDIAANNSLGCGLVRKRNNDTPMTINEAHRRLHELIVENKTKRGSSAIRNIEIHGIITDINGFRIIDWCGKCKRRVKARVCKRCGTESIARIQIFGQVSDPTGTVLFYGEDRVAEILLSAHPAHIISSIDIQRGILLTFKYHLKQSKISEKKNKINFGNPWKLLSSLVNSNYAENLIGLPVCMAGNLELTSNKKQKIMKIFWFETKTYQEEVVDIEKRPEIKHGSKIPIITRRIECLRML